MGDSGGGSGGKKHFGSTGRRWAGLTFKALRSAAPQHLAQPAKRHEILPAKRRDFLVCLASQTGQPWAGGVVRMYCFHWGLGAFNCTQTFLKNRYRTLRRLTALVSVNLQTPRSKVLKAGCPPTFDRRHFYTCRTHGRPA